MDRFSNLPDEVSHHILYFLDTKDLTRLGTVSKSCRRLHLSTPTIRVYRCFVVHNSVDPHLSNFLSSFDRFLIQRGNSKIHIFPLRLCRVFSANATARGFDEELYQIFSWIHNVVRCNVEVLEFELVEAGYIQDYEGALLEFPSCVFSCRSLRSLRLSLRYGIIKSPLSSPSSNNIVFLRLNFVTLEEGFCKWISCCCKCIKDIRLESVKGIENITIESSLESFEVSGVGLLYLKVFGEELERISIDWSHNSPNDRLFVMSAPNLKYLSWIGNVMNNNLNFGELLRLEKVKLSHRFGVYDLDSAFKFLYSIRRVKFLILDEATMKVLFRCLVPGPLHDVTFLRIEFEELIEDDIIPTLVSLFKAVPNLNTLHIRRKFFRYQETHSSLFSKSYWELQNLAFVSQLKQVTMDLTYESNGIELAKYSCDDHPNLKRILTESTIASKATVVQDDIKWLHSCYLCGLR